MLDAFYGTKQKQTRIFTESGMSIPVTEISVMPGRIVQLKRQDKDGYNALQVGFNWHEKKARKSLQGHLKQTGHGTTHQPRFLREIAVADFKKAENEEFKINDEVKAEEVFQVGDKVKVTGVSKAKGFQGGVKRHGFHGGPKTHGQSDRHRAPGAIGAGTTPGRVYKGKRMAGRTGGDQVTVSGLTIVNIDPEKNTITVKGLIPGNKSKLVLIQKQ